MAVRGWRRYFAGDRGVIAGLAAVVQPQPLAQLLPDFRRTARQTNQPSAEATMRPTAS